MRSMIPIITPSAVHQMMREGEKVPLIDVRSPAEYADSHVAGAISMPLDEVDAERVSARFSNRAGTSTPLYLICASGRRAEQAGRKLKAQGLTRVALVDGGIQAWAAQQLPLQRKSRLPSLERQSQVAVGALILLMLAKGSLLHPLFYALVGLLGVGLIWSGITARCSLSALLARMPWNRPEVHGTTSSA